MSVNNNFDPSSFGLISGMGYKITSQSEQSSDKTSMEAQNMLLKINDGDIRMNVNVHHLEADIYDKTPNDPLSFDDMSSMDMNIKSGIVNLKDTDLSISMKNIMSKEIKSLKDVNISFMPNNKIEVNLKLKKFLSLNVKVEGDISIDPFNNNTLKLTPQKISVNKIPIKGLLNLLHLKVGEVVKINRPTGSVYTSGDSMYICPDKIMDAPKINGNITGIKTGIGSISVMLGKDDVNTYKTKLEQGSENYVKIKGGNVEFNGINIKNSDVSLIDKTPNTPFDLDDDPSTKVIRKGQISVPDTFIKDAMIKSSGEDSALKNMNFSISNGVGKLTGSKWGFVPVKVDLKFDKSEDGQLKITPNNSKAFGFIPLPNSYIKNAMAEQVNGEIDDKSIILDLKTLADIESAPFKNIKIDNGKLILDV